jgi:hypothetical protein
MVYRYRPGDRSAQRFLRPSAVHYQPGDFFETTTRQGKDNVWYNYRCLAPGCPRPTGFDVVSEAMVLANFNMRHVPTHHGTIRGIVMRMTPEERDVLNKRTLQGRGDMGTIEDLERQRNVIASQAERLLRQLDQTDVQLEEERTRQADRLEKYGEDAFPEGAVITFLYQFPNPFQKGPDGQRIYRPMKYLYAAIKADNLWYTTGPKSPKAYTWQNLIDWWENGRVTKLRIVTKTEKLGQ